MGRYDILHRSAALSRQTSIYQQSLLHLAETLHTVHLFLEVVVAKGGIGEGAADAVLAEASGEDAHVEEDVLHGRMDEAVAFQFDNYAVPDVSARVDVVVVEPQAKVDGEAFGHTMVDEGDAVEEVLGDKASLTPDLGGTASTSDCGKALAARLK